MEKRQSQGKEREIMECVKESSLYSFLHPQKSNYLSARAEIINFRTVSLFLLLFALYSSAGAEQYNWFVNPGIKIGIAFGKKPCAVLGGEISVGKYVSRNASDKLFGFVLGSSHCYNGTRNVCGYVEAEYGTVIGGGSIGVAYDSYLKVANPYLRAFGGYAMYVSYRYAFGKIPNEFSVAAKVPLYSAFSE